MDIDFSRFLKEMDVDALMERVGRRNSAAESTDGGLTQGAVILNFSVELLREYHDWLVPQLARP